MVFARFKRTYIDPRRNFFSEVCDAPAAAFLGNATDRLDQQRLKDDRSSEGVPLADQRLAVARSIVRSFVIYQLSNRFPPNGSGVGCGLYDESGSGDGGAIGKWMSEYAFDFCFNPDIHEDNAILFLDSLLSG